MPSIHAHCQQRGAAALPPSTFTCGTRTPLCQLYTESHAHNRGIGSVMVMVPLHTCQWRCPHTAGAAPTLLPLPATAAPARCELAVNMLRMEAMAELQECGGTAGTACAPKER